MSGHPWKVCLAALHLAIRCEGADNDGLMQLVPSAGTTVAVTSGSNVRIAVQFDPNRDVIVEGNGGGYGQKPTGDNPPSSCDPGQPCGKPFKLASTYSVGVLEADRDWFSKNLPEGTYKSPTEIMSALLSKV